MKRVLITGSEGFIGKALIRSLVDSKSEVTTLDLHDSSQEFMHLKVDVVDPNLSRAVREIRPDVIVHLAAQINVLGSFDDPLQDLRSNGEGTLNLIRASIDSGCKNFIYVGSGGATYDSHQPLPISESGREYPVSPYGLTKLLGEGYVRVFSERAGTQWSSLALSNCYGNVLEHRRGVIFQFWNALNNKKSPKIYGQMVTRDFVHVQDVVRAIHIAMGKPTNSRVNISSGIEVTLMELFEIIKKEMKSNLTPEIFNALNGEVVRSALDNEKAFQILGWKPTTDLVTGIQNSLPKSEMRR